MNINNEKESFFSAGRSLMQGSNCLSKLNINFHLDEWKSLFRGPDIQHAEMASGPDGQPGSEYPFSPCEVAHIDMSA